MQGITPHLWFDREAVEAAELYTDTFPDSRIVDVNVIRDTPSGDTAMVSFELAGQPFAAISAGPMFRFNPSVSFLVACETADEVDALWQRLGEGGEPLMPLGSYPFSDHYGWTTDRYGLSWQVMRTDDVGEQRITPTLMFVGDVCGKAEEAIGLYTSLFPDAGIEDVLRYGPDEAPDVAGTVKHAGFRLGGRRFAAMDSAHDHRFAFNEAISFMVTCDDQAEIDRYWEALSAVPEAEQCGWLADRFGVSWQIVPAEMGEMLGSGSEEQRARVTQAFLGMKKFDVAALRRAYDGVPASQ